MMKRTWNALRVGLFLSNRQIRANIGTTLLIIVVMALTYLDLLVVSGVMVGMVQGVRNERQTSYTGQIMLSNYTDKNSIQDSPAVEAYLHAIPSIASFTPRYVAPGRLKANYATLLNLNDKPDSILTNVLGIDPTAEDATTGLSHLVVEGQYLQPNDYDQILLGTALVSRYKALMGAPGSVPLPHVGVGSKVRVLVGGVEREMTVKGIVASKLEEINTRAYMVGTQMRSILGRTDKGVNEIAIQLVPGANAAIVEQQLKQSVVAADAQIKSSFESEPAFLGDFAKMFNQLGSFLGNIGLVIAFIVIFILVYINIITRRRSIGILQAIGIRSSGIEIAYALQSVLYAIIGAVIGIVLLFMIIEPYFLSHPLDFPFSNGILTVSFSEALMKGFVLLVAIIFASFIPARMIMRQEIVDAILGR